MTERDDVLEAIEALSRDVPVGWSRVHGLKIFPNQIILRRHDGRDFLVTVARVRKPREPKL